MLEEIKEVLINEMQQQLQQRKSIEEEIKTISKERDQKQEQALQNLTKLESQIEAITNKSFRRIFYGKQIKGLLSDYTDVSNIAREDIRCMNEKIETLYQKIHDLSHDEVLIEREIERIKKATSFEELGLTERTALKYIKNDDKKVVRAVFKNIKDNQLLESIIDINKTMISLYQTNISPFVVAMQKINFSNLNNELINIGIIIDSDKVMFIEKLLLNVNNYENINISVKSELIENELDNDFYKLVEQELSYMNKTSSNWPLTTSKIITLAILVSIAKTNKQQKINQK